MWSGLPVNAALIACELDEDAAATAFIAVGLASIHGLRDDPDRIWDVLRIAAGSPRPPGCSGVWSLGSTRQHPARSLRGSRRAGIERRP